MIMEQWAAKPPSSLGSYITGNYAVNCLYTELNETALAQWRFSFKERKKKGVVYFEEMGGAEGRIAEFLLN